MHMLRGQKKNIDFNTYEYYSAVRCNRPETGEIGGLLIGALGSTFVGGMRKKKKERKPETAA